MFGRAKLHSCPLEPRPLPSLPTYRTAPSPVSFCCSHTLHPLSSLLQSSHLHPLMMPGLCLSGYTYTFHNQKRKKKKTQPTSQSSHLHPFDAWLVSFRIQYTHFTTQSTRKKKTQPTSQSSHLHHFMMPGLCLFGYNIHISQPKAQEKRHKPCIYQIFFVTLQRKSATGAPNRQT